MYGQQHSFTDSKTQVDADVDAALIGYIVRSSEWVRRRACACVCVRVVRACVRNAHTLTATRQTLITKISFPQAPVLFEIAIFSVP